MRAFDHRGIACPYAGSRQGEEPANISRRDQMPGGAHYMGAQDGSIGKSLLKVIICYLWQAQAERPFGCREFLGLDCPEPLHKGLRSFRYMLRKLLLVKSLLCNIQSHHSAFVSCSVSI